MTERATGLSLAGIVFRTQQEVLREMVGDAPYDAALARMDAADRDVVRSAGVLGWVPTAIVERLVASIAHETGRTVDRVQREMAFETARRTLRGVWRILARLASREQLLSRMGILWSKAYDRGQIRVVELTSSGGRFALEGVPDASDYALRGVSYSMEALLQHAGRQTFRMRWERTADGATFELSWRQT